MDRKSSNEGGDTSESVFPDDDAALERRLSQKLLKAVEASPDDIRKKPALGDLQRILRNDLGLDN